MASKRDQGSASPTTSTEPTGPVLIYLNRKGGWKQMYYQKSASTDPGGRIPGALNADGVRISPGLGLIPRPAWEAIKDQSRFKRRREQRQIRVIAGEDESLAQGWFKADEQDCYEWLEKTSTVDVLELLREVESGYGTEARLGVSDAIDHARERVKVLRAKQAAERSQQRSRNRQAAW